MTLSKRYIRRRNYRKGRRALIKQMGGKCFRCKYKWRLEFHHLVPRTWDPAKTSRWVRLARYRREWKAGIVCLACKRCNKLIGRPLAQTVQDPEIPF